MDTLKQLLGKNYSNKTKDELVDLVTEIETLLGEEFNQISEIKSEEILKMTKKDLIATIETIKDNYEPEWEKMLASANRVTTDVFQKVASLDLGDAGSLLADSNAADADFAAELGSIDFANIIGGPLNACVTAQNNASLATTAFIKENAFETTGTGKDAKSKVRMTDFSYTKEVTDPKDPKKTIPEEVKLKVPFITLLNIPSMRVETCNIDFNVKLDSVYTRDVTSAVKADASVSANYWAAKFQVSVSAQRSTSTGVKVKKEYSLGVKVVAGNDEMPAGLEKVLGILSA